MIYVSKQPPKTNEVCSANDKYQSVTNTDCASVIKCFRISISHFTCCQVNTFTVLDFICIWCRESLNSLHVQLARHIFYSSTLCTFGVYRL